MGWDGGGERWYLVVGHVFFGHHGGRIRGGCRKSPKLQAGRLSSWDRMERKRVDLGINIRKQSSLAKLDSSRL